MRSFIKGFVKVCVALSCFIGTIWLALLLFGPKYAEPNYDDYYDD